MKVSRFLIVRLGFALFILSLMILAGSWQMLLAQPGINSDNGALATSITVTSLADNTNADGFCTLREALINANNNAATHSDCAAGVGADVIDLTGLSGQITLLSNLPELTDPAGLTVQGPGAATLAISGNDAYRMFRVFEDNPPIDGPLTVRDLTLRNAKGDNPGSVIRTPSGSAVEVWNSVMISNTQSAIAIAGGSLKVSHTTFSGNITTGTGGAIQAINNFQAAQPAPTVWVDASTFTHNQAGGGHAIEQAGGSLTLNNSVFQQNGTTTEGHGTVEYSGDMDITVTNCEFRDNQTRQGGALHDAGGVGVVYIQNSQFIGNVAGYAAGVIRSGGHRALDIRHSLFMENAALANGKGGVIYSYAPITITASAFYSNTAQLGGVIMTENDATGPITIFDSLFQGNHATHSGGAIWFGRGLYITNTTFYTNTADYAGGALGSYEGWGEINNSTFDHNGANDRGAALYFDNGWAPPITLRNTIVANPLRGNNCYAYTGAYTDGGGNLQYPGTSCNAAIPELNPLLDPAGPQDNGGPTPSIALQAGSPAIDRIPVGGGFYCPPTDQRGAIRPADGDGNDVAGCDSGAYETGAIGPITLSKTALDVNGVPLLPGDIIRYTLRAENTFTQPVSGVVITDAIPAGATYVTNSDTPEAVADSDPLVWNGLNLASNEVFTFTFEVMVNPLTGGQVIENSACFSQPGVPQICTEPVQPEGQNGGTVQPVLSISKTALDVNGAPLLPGDVIRYTIAVTNSNAVTVTNATVSDAVPAHTTYVADSDMPEAGADSSPLTWSGQTFAAGASRTYQFEVTVNPLTGGQVIENSACFSQPGVPQICTEPVQPEGEDGGTVQPVLSISKTAFDVNGEPLLPGDVIRYTIAVTNAHAVTVTNATVSDAVPANATYVADSDTPEAGADSSPLTWSGQTFAAGASRTYQFEVTVNPLTGGQVIENSACFSQPGVPQICTEPVQPEGEDGGTVLPVLSISKTALDVNGAPLLPGDIIAYTIAVSNPYQITIADATISDTIPANTTYLADSDTPEAGADSSPLTWSGQTFAAGASRTYQFEVTVNPLTGGQVIENSACFSQPGVPQICTEPVEPEGEDGGTVQPALSIGKTALDVNGGILQEGDAINYTIIITNGHGVAVNGIVISDTIPLSTTYVANSDSPEANADSNPLVWSGQNIESGEVLTFTFAVTVNHGALGAYIRNSACLSQPGLPGQTCTAPVEPSGGGQVRMSLFMPIIMRD